MCKRALSEGRGRWWTRLKRRRSGVEWRGEEEVLPNSEE